MLKVEGVELILADIKTLELTLNKKEQEFMDSTHPPKYSTGYINDNVIDSFLLLCQRQNPEARLYVISAGQGSAILKESKQQTLIKSHLESIDWATFSQILCPVNIGRHWVLVHIILATEHYNITGNNSETYLHVKYYDENAM